MITTFIQSNWPVLLVLLGSLMYIGMLVWQGNWTKLREIAYKAMLQAEKAFGKGGGSEKFDAVFKEVYKQLPVWFQIIFPADQAARILKVRIQEWYDMAKDWTDDGIINDSTAEN